MRVALIVLLSYAGIYILSSSAPLINKLAINCTLGLCALYAINSGGFLYISLNMFTAAILTLCGPAGLLLSAVIESMAV